MTSSGIKKTSTQFWTVHDRMPVILASGIAEEWLERLEVGFLKPITEDFLIKTPALSGSLRVESEQAKPKFID